MKQATAIMLKLQKNKTMPILSTSHNSLKDKCHDSYISTMQLLKKPKQTTNKPKITKSPRKLEGESSYKIVYKVCKGRRTKMLLYRIMESFRLDKILKIKSSC